MVGSKSLNLEIWRELNNAFHGKRVMLHVPTETESCALDMDSVYYFYVTFPNGSVAHVPLGEIRFVLEIRSLLRVFHSDKFPGKLENELTLHHGKFGGLAGLVPVKELFVDEDYPVMLNVVYRTRPPGQHPNTPLPPHACLLTYWTGLGEQVRARIRSWWSSYTSSSNSEGEENQSCVEGDNRVICDKKHLS